MSRLGWLLFDLINFTGLGTITVLNGYPSAGWCIIGLSVGVAIGRVAGTLSPLDAEEAR